MRKYKRDLPHIEVFSPRELSQERWPEIQELRRNYYLGVLAGKETAKVEAFVSGTTQKKWDNPNKAVGSGLTRARQAFARTRVVASFNAANELTGYVYAADNASSSREFPRNLVGAPERWAKLHVSHPKLLGSRVRVLREIVLVDETTLPVMAGVALRDAGEQPVAVYPVNYETEQISGLMYAGLRRAEFDPKAILQGEEPDDEGAAVLTKLWAPHADLLLDGFVGHDGHLRQFVDAVPRH